MDILDRAFHTYLGQLGWRALADLIADKAAAQGIQLTPREKAALARRLAKTDATEEVTLHKRKDTTEAELGASREHQAVDERSHRQTARSRVPGWS